jgi:hypothetical protein
MSPLAPYSKMALRAGIVAALVVSLPLVGLGGVARADLGDEPSSKSASSGDQSQVEDNDKPKDLLGKKPADAAVQQQKQVDTTPIYEKWQFWAITGGILVGIVAVVWGAQALSHQINGGDVRPCNMDFQMRCFGEGR